MRITFAIILLVSFATSACTPKISKQYQQAVSSWVGHHKDALVRTWGVPTAEQKLTDGGSVVEYYRTGMSSAVPIGTPSGFPIYTNVTNWCRTTFSTDAQLVVNNWRIDGNSCR